MSYEKTNWQNGITPLNAQNMNHIENGISENDTNIKTTNNRLNDVKSDVRNLNEKIPMLMILND